MTPSSVIEHGLEPAMRPVLPGFDSGIMTMILACFVVNALVFPTLLRLWREFFKELGRVRRTNMATEHTVSERWIMFIALMQTLLFEALTLFCAFRQSPGAEAFRSFLGGLLLASLLMCVQVTGYLLVGYAFAPAGEMRRWLRSFVLTQTMAGYLLVLPALAALFYPTSAPVFCSVCLAIYIGCRILFCIKGFTIFYTSPASLFYFFLYLCTIEIVPLLTVWSVAGYFLQLFC